MENKSPTGHQLSADDTLADGPCLSVISAGTKEIIQCQGRHLFVINGNEVATSARDWPLHISQIESSGCFNATRS